MSRERHTRFVPRFGSPRFEDLRPLSDGLGCENRDVEEADVRTIRLRYKAAYEACHALAAKSGTEVSPQEYQAALERLETARQALMDALVPSRRSAN